MVVMGVLSSWEMLATKLAAAGLALGNGVGHGVEGLGQLAHLVLPLLIALHPHLVLAVAEFAGGLGDLLQGLVSRREVMELVMKATHSTTTAVKKRWR